MARVTIEDCIRKVPNPFELVLLASHRVHQIATGAALTLERDNDKNSVVALREIADGTVSVEKLHESAIKSFQKHVEMEEESTPVLDEMLAEESGWLHGTGGGDIQQELQEDELSVTEDLEEINAVEEDDAEDESSSEI